MQLVLWLVVGLVLGPSLLGITMPAFFKPLSSLAGALFLALAGWELRFLDFKNNKNFYAKVFVGTFIFPFFFSYFCFQQNYFIGLALAISALPITIQILKEKDLYETDLARKTVTLASLVDICAWAGMAFLIPASDLRSWILSHWVVLAFFAGIILGHFFNRAKNMRAISLQKWLLAPLFFAALGWQIDLKSSFSFKEFASLFLVAIFVKLVGTYVTARWSGESHREALNLASLLNARGAMEIIAANFAYNAGLINATTLSSLVLIGITTSFIAVILVKKT
ncbi:cation:proton antiporter [Bdellovibrio reynosensis]|uniref:Cation:proton antiporter n=1 Tax=Bdellovibrio reynosensis TaxID=2835041 RepID=A0ABY4C9N1_9BACT|nr:cation:proton antiporter [Bdellovibrio reynosensis]UOF01184.1 cation:proton antiporter [Bdellovibrio reynosensis]